MPLLLLIAYVFAGVVLVPTAPLPADGETASTVRVFIDGGETRVRVKSEVGRVGAAQIGNDGIAAFAFTPGVVSVPQLVQLKVIVAGTEFPLDVPVAPKFAGSLGVSFDPPIGSATGTTMVKITPSGSSPVAAEGRRFVVTPSVGSVDIVTPAGDGTWVARYTPPKSMSAPAMVVVTASDAAAPEIQGWATLPVTIRRSITLDAPAGSSNVLQAGGKQFGPFVAAPSNKVAFDIELDPRVRTGKLQTVNVDTSKTQRDIELPGSAPASQLAFLPAASTIPADPSLKVPIRVAVVGSDGESAPGAGMILTASGGVVSTPGPDGRVQLASFSPPATAGEVTLTAELNGVKATKKLKIVAALPQVSLTADPLSKSGSSVKVTARLKDAQGTGIPGRAPIFSAEGASASGSVRDNKDGSYTATFSVSSKTIRARVSAVPPVEASGMAPVRIIAWPASPTVTANGQDSTGFTIVALDAFDLPVPNLEFKLGVPAGDGGVPLTVKADARGIARGTYKAGATPGMAGVRIEAMGLTAGIPIFQAKGAGAAPPPGGGPAHEAALQRWRTAAPSVTILREGSVPPSGPPAVVQIAAVPPYTTPGAAILVQVRVTDTAGTGVGGQKLEVLASPAAAGALTDNRDGTYNLPVQLPAGTDGPLTITVKAGEATGSIVLPTLAEAGTAPRQPISKSGGPAKTGGAKPVSGDRPRIRVAVGLTNAHGGYVMEVSGGGSSLPPEAGYNAPGVGFMGLSARGEWWALDQSWGALAADARADLALEFFDVEGDEFVHPARNLVLGARYRRPFGPFSVQGALGFHTTVGTVFQYEDESRTAAELQVVPIYGGRIGVIAALELGRIYLEGEFAETFAPFPLVTHGGGALDVLVTEQIGVRAGVDWEFRTMELEKDDEEANIRSSYVTVILGSSMRFF